MSAAAQAIRDLLAPLLPQWVVQYGRFEDEHGAAKRYVVLKPAGGARAELIRQPQFTLMLIGRDQEDRLATSDAADMVVEHLRLSSGRLVFLQPAEPVFMATDDGRPVFEIALSAITT